ncbi:MULTISPECIES: 50S ribosomal protein L35 [unclassified Campylobacter]|uniref:50S ribosomal protein L35 n=1 Tax=unclassified Campylobacter TaxID=2593542 RepID=UPI001BDAB395|nr:MULTISPECIES: 50S ribosomal protein L35 [unclassified Campylobacter]MBZ7975643.1 50S ribosomal protein L35 [Campylobacter sp. RM12637]MBZ7977348.1 50S ribosomal protein L35 [Campylobacter sp. RM12654]MBZ7979474.1 50S ribosomal protein L35 [Campylobacter sp. RM12642]MBZ7980956.1 50S ribosomal protein L35 [Campylobacter sp. RM12640]MBZ7983947.1 50S ribosomal protein L35 [Campylobacter sp. RM12647]MBZ7986443.1 50S ribosomal protein L35 [Campylobacter sp. Cr9]MBZ7988275.1 50S ribosomal protei
MPKMKSVKSASKRFRVGKNKIKRGSAYRSHILTKKPAKRMRDLRTAKFVHATNESRVLKMLCMK